MTEQIPLRLATMSPSAALTPAGLQRTSVIFQRRLLVAGLNVTTYSGACLFHEPRAREGGWTWLDAGSSSAFVFAAPWSVLGFWNAVIGLWLLHWPPTPVAAGRPFAGRRRGAGSAAAPRC